MDTKSAEERERLARHWAGRIVQTIQQVLPTNANEAELRRNVEPLLDQFCESVGLNPLVHAEYTLATGRADTVFNRLVIEFERPGVLKRSLADRGTAHAVKQVKDYVEALAAKERRELHRLAGVAYDGRSLIFARWTNGEWSIEQPVEANQHTTEKLLTWLAGLSSGIALTAEKLNEDFSIEQLRTRNVLRALYHAANAALADQNSLVAKLFEQWRLFFSESIDYYEAFGGRKLEPLKKWVRRARIEVHSAEDAERFFFALHTYFALLLKLLAWLALSRHLGVKIGAPSFGGLIGTDSESLRRELADMESGGIFRKFGLVNLLEGDFFAWYVHAWNSQIETAVRDVLKRLDEYDPSTLTLIPEETRDLFKKLYHYLLPREVRHNLGEYYTPDWLAQRLLNQVDNEFFTADPARAELSLRRKLSTVRFLDPACGSGTFLVLVIARMRELADALLVDQGEQLAAVLRNVVGFDLNPLAVLTARVNYLLQIADLLEYRKGDIAIPVYLADSVRMPAEGEGLFGRDAYEFPTAVGSFLVPAPLCTKERFDRFCELLEDGIRDELAPEALIRRVETALRLGQPEWTPQAASRLREVYDRLLDLHRRGLNGLWARLLKNNFAPLTVGPFDYVVGNPPWVNWQDLPDGYRDSTKPVWVRYGLFPHGGMATILGKGKKDISTLMTYTVADGLLSEGGRLGFIITQSVFKGSGASQGFRRFRVPADGRAADGKAKEMPLRVVHVDDMESLNPFEGASNRTTVMVIDKGRPTQYPIPYTLWLRQRGARFTYDSTLTDVTRATRRLDYQARPVDDADPTSAWLTARPQALRALRKVLGRSDYEAHAGSYTGGANAVYWLEIVTRRPDGLVVVQNVTEGAKVNVEQTTDAIEPDLLYPLLRGRDVARWQAAPSALILMAQDPVKRRGIDEAEMQERWPRTYGYLKRFEDVLRARRSRGVSDMLKRGAPFYTMFAVSDYTFAPWKVVWREVANTLDAAVVGPEDGKPTVPDHTLISVECQSEDEALYLCAALNSAPSRLAIQAYIVLHPDPHTLEHVSIPKFDPTNPVHKRLAELSAEARAAAQRADMAAVQSIEAEIDRQAALLWGLTSQEVSEIERNLRELASQEKDEPVAATAEE